MKIKSLSNLISINLVACLLCFSSLYAQQKLSQVTQSPHLKKTGKVTRLIVNGKPFLSLAGEVHNSSTSSLEYMEAIWPKLVRMNLNTILAPVSWELHEPSEGKFDFTLVDGLIKKARENKMKIIFLWFGSWKNMVSTYVPAWVKNDPARFPLYASQTGKKFQMLSAISKENTNADAKAFAALMKHIKQVDASEQTVIMMQVQNEVGTSGGQRDSSKIALDAYKNKVPEKLMTYLQKNKSTLIPEFAQVWAINGYKTTGTWQEIFGEGAAGNEIFMAYYLANFVGEVIKAGKAEYDIPMFVNASVGRQDGKIGTYPSGGPVPFVMDVWRAGAPQLDMLCPDIYVANFTEWLERYKQSGNPLYIPETRAGELGAVNAIKAFCNYDAIGFSPFGIESVVEDSANGPMTQTYTIIKQLAPMILTKEGKKQMIAVSVDTGKTHETVSLGKYLLDFELRRGRQPTNNNPGLGYALLIETNPNEFIAVGKNINIQFSTLNKQGQLTGILAADQGTIKQGVFIPSRRLNGDEIMDSYDFSNLVDAGKSGNGLKFVERLGVQRVKLYQY